MNRWLERLHEPYPLALGVDGWVDNRRFARDVAGVCTALRQCRDDDLALQTENAYWFAVGLFAAWQAGKRVHLGGAVTMPLLGDSAAAPFCLPELAAGEAAPLQPLDMQNRVLVYTSGSTGAPKAIAKTLRQLHAETLALEALFGARLGDALMLGCVSPLHLYGLLFRVLWPLFAGRPFMAETAFFPEQLAAQSRLAPRVAWVATPAHYKRIGDALPWHELHGRLAALFCSAGALPADCSRRLNALAGVPVTEIFGSSETGGVAWREQPEDWLALPGVLVRASEDGALRVQSPHLGHTGWESMDDAVRFDGDGRFALLGRLDRIVKIEGRRIALAGIEQALLALDELVDAAVYAETGDGRQQVCAVVVASDAGRAALAEMGASAFGRHLRQQLAGALDALAIPRRWRFVDALPRNAQGKVAQAALQALFADARDRREPLVLSQELGDDRAVLRLAVAADIPFFEGHFPQAPILPGVTQIHWAAGLASRCFAMGKTFQRMEAVKFQQVIRPGDEVELELNWDAGKGRLSFTYRSGRGNHSSGRLVFAP
ncbi:AMP-binding protein [Chitinilyticum litopenaei]|uniref:AMP-binding protein n=1 Tax=Chitinilyticum litopenaei TaxID=1121276 RepID=UPI000416239A|nr:AMP-binding protein [Chitinilyticum litopenaei]